MRVSNNNKPFLEEIFQKYFPDILKQNVSEFQENLAEIFAHFKMLTKKLGVWCNSASQIYIII